MNNFAEHTFVIPAYMDSPYIEECILSLENQTAPGEILISTPTPSEFLGDISAKYGIPLFVNRESKGIGADWSFAYSLCSTKYVTIVHQDDIYLPCYAEHCLAAMRRNPDALIAFTDYAELLDGKEVAHNLNLWIKRVLLLPFWLKRGIRSGFVKKLILFFGSPISCPSVMFNRALIGAFDFAREFRCNMDWDAWLRLAEREGNFVFVPQVLMHHRVHRDAETTVQVRTNVRSQEDLAIFRRMWPEPIARLLSKLYNNATRSLRKDS